MVKGTGRADHPIEAARRAVSVASDALASTLGYLREPTGPDARRTFETLVKGVEEMLGRLRCLDLSGPYDTEVPPQAVDVLAQADQMITDIIVHTHIEDVAPRLHAPQARLRSLIGEARRGEGPTTDTS